MQSAGLLCNPPCATGDHRRDLQRQTHTPKELTGALGDGARPRRHFRLWAPAGGSSSKDPWQIFRSPGTQEMMKHNRKSAVWNGWRSWRCWFAVYARFCRPPDASRCDSVQTNVTAGAAIMKGFTTADPLRRSVKVSTRGATISRVKACGRLPPGDRQRVGWRARSQHRFHQGFLSVGVAEQLATMKGRYLMLEWYPFYQVYVHELEMAALVPLLSSVSGAPVATTEGAELLGITADKLVVACRPGNLRRGRGARRTEIREVAAVTHNLQQRGVAEAGDVRFAAGQRLGSAVMLLQEVRSWPGGQNVLLGHELFTDVGLDTAVAIPRAIACDVRENGQKSARFSFYLVHLGFNLSSMPQ